MPKERKTVRVTKKTPASPEEPQTIAADEVTLEDPLIIDGTVVRTTTPRSDRERDVRTKRRLRDRAERTTERSMDVGARLARGMVMAHLEQMRLTAEVVATFVEEVMDRNSPDSSRRVRARRRASDAEPLADDDEPLLDDEPRRGSRRRRDSAERLAKRLPKHMSFAHLRAFDQALEIPRKTMEKFLDVYDETERQRAN